MPRKTKQEIEQLVRDFYENLTAHPFIDAKADGAEVTFTVTEEEIQKAIASYEEKSALQENAERYFRIREYPGELLHKLMEQYNIQPEIMFEREVCHVLDVADTEEAERRNVELLRSISTREGYRRYILEQIDLAMNIDTDQIFRTTPVDGAQLFFNPRTAIPIQAAFLGKDLIDGAQKAGIELSEETKKTLLYNQRLLGHVIHTIGSTQKALRNESTACINTDIDIVKKILEEPQRYQTTYDVDSFDTIAITYSDITDNRPFTETDTAYTLNRLIEGNNIPKDMNFLLAVEDGEVRPYTDADGRNMMAKFEDGRMLTWERNIPAPTLRPDDNYEAVRNQIADIAHDIDVAGVRFGNTSQQFKNVLRAFDAINEHSQKGINPDDLEKDKVIAGLYSNLEDAVKAMRKTFPLDKLIEDPILQKQSELVSTLGTLKTLEHECRKLHRDQLPENVFGREIEELLRKPEYDFNIMSKADSLRIRSFALYKEADSNQIQEETEYLLTDYHDADAKKMPRAEYDKHISDNAYKFLYSQHTINQTFGEQNVKLYQNAKSCNLILYPKNGDPVHARMIYVDRNGKPRISGELGNMPVLGDTMARMDALRNEGKGFQDFPEHSIDTIAARAEMAMPMFTQDCADFFPDAENLDLLVSNALNYSAARQNFALSSYGDVYLTEEQKQDDALVEQAAVQKEAAIAEVLVERQHREEIMFDASMHPEYYKDEPVALERAAVLRAKAELTYRPDGPDAAEYKKTYDAHYFDMCNETESFLKKNNLQLKDVKFFDENGNELVNNNRPWQKLEAAAKIFDKDGAVFMQRPGENTLQKLEMRQGELKINVADVGRDFNDPDVKLSRKDTLTVATLFLNELNHTGTTKRDSQEYRDMVEAARQCVEVANRCKGDDATPQAIIAHQKLEEMCQKMSAAADKYYLAKVDQSMNSRRAERFAVAMRIRHFADKPYLEYDIKPKKMMREAIAAKICKTEALKAIKNNSVFAEEARKMLSDGKVMNKKVLALADTNAFKSMTEDLSREGLNKMLKTDPGKLIKKFKENGAPEINPLEKQEPNLGK